MAFQFGPSSISPGQEIRLYFQFNNYQYAGVKVMQAKPFHWFDIPSSRFLITSDIGHEQRLGADNLLYYVYSVAVKNVGNVATPFYIVGGDVS